LNKLMSMLRLTVGFAFVSVTAILTCLIAIPLLPSRPMRIKLCNYYGKFVGYVVVRLAAVTPEVNHRERLNQSFPAIYIANHTSTLDAFLSIWLCPIGGCGVMKKEILKIPFFNLLYLLSGHLLLDRAKPQEAVSMLTGLAEVVKRHRLAIWIMPEGTRSRDGRLLPFKKGFVHLAIATGLPVVPVVFHGANKNWQKGTLRFRKMNLTIDVLEPVDTSGWTAENAEAHAASVHDLVAAALGEEQRPLAALPA
jgi:lysophosphatidate acyltransferase